MAEHRFVLTASWRGGRNGEGEIACGNLRTVVSAPKEMDGPGVGTNPEELLLGAAATCYLITLAAVLERRELPVADLTVTSEGTVGTEGGLRFQKIVHRTRIRLSAGATAEQVEAARQAAERAEQACMISKAVRGNVEVSVDPEVVTG
ncbi:MAG: SACOL1771 family peroxiredoxin [Alicyclobacillaceae bacterium]|nr:SACOL1771 family peroxiredoxin [Alicyclobacillaceae bacterium]